MQFVILPFLTFLLVGLLFVAFAFEGCRESFRECFFEMCCNIFCECFANMSANAFAYAFADACVFLKNCESLRKLAKAREAFAKVIAKKCCECS